MDEVEVQSPYLNSLVTSASAQKYVREEKQALKKQKLIRERGEKTKSAKKHSFKFPKHLPESDGDPTRVGNIPLVYFTNNFLIFFNARIISILAEATKLKFSATDVLKCGILSMTKCCSAATTRGCSDVCHFFTDSDTGETDVTGAIEFVQCCFERVKLLQARKDTVNMKQFQSCVE